MLKESFSFIFILFFLHAVSQPGGKQHFFEPGKVWYDTDGKPIAAHGAGLLYHNGVYYWYGETRASFSTFPGFSCYSSKDLFNWKNEGYALLPVKDNPNHDLYETNIIERPKVIYNDRTKKFVMWMHVEDNKYQIAHAGVAWADKPTGPFHYVKSMLPNGAESRDESIFKDDDGKAYLIHASEKNATQHINLLSEDYLDVESIYVRVWQQEWREAPAIFKHKGKYYSITSRCTGFSPNEAKYAVAENMLGEWKIVGNPAVGIGNESCFRSQAAFVLPVAGKPGTFIYVADRWTPGNLGDSRYVWLPIQMNDNGKLKIEWKDKWNFSSAPNGYYDENPQGPDLSIYEIANGFPLLDRLPDITIKRKEQTQDFSALAWAGWRNGKIVFSVVVYHETALIDTITPSFNLSEDMMDIWLNFFQVSIQKNGRIWYVVPGSSGNGDLGGILLTKKFEHPAIRCTTTENYTTTYSSLLHLPKNEKGTLYQIEVSDTLALMRPFKAATSIAFCLVLNNRDITGKGLKNRSFYPATWRWADTDTYSKMMLVK
jgi:hypothetical protein